MSAIGDLVRAVVALGLFGEDAVAAARSLGFVGTPLTPSGEPKRTEVETEAKPLDGGLDVTRPTPGGETPAPAGVSAASGVSIRDLGGPDQRQEPAWLGRPLQMAPPSTDGPKLDLEPLLAPRSTRAILGAAVASETEDGPLDLPRLIADVAQLRPIRKIHRLRKWTLARGVQVLVDAGPRLAPFAPDIELLVRRLGEVAGRSELLRFVGTPARVRPAGGRMRPYRLPRAGVPVFAVTDLGIAPANDHELLADPLADWLELAARLRAHGSPLVALVPYPKRRWPRRAVAAMSILEWDRTTTTDVVHKTRRRVNRDHES